MKFSLAKGPYLRSKRSTTGIMIELFAVLSVVWITSIVAYSIRFNFTVGLRGLLVGLVSLVTTIAIDVIMALVYKERTFKGICKFVLNSYSYVTALIFALCLPIGVNLYVVVIGAIVATLLGKYAFGGFGYNIFNPAIIGRIFVGLSFPNMMNYGIVSNSTGSTYDFVTGSTVTGSVDWSNGLIPNGYDLKQLLFGNYNGAMGETFTILLVVLGIILAIRKDINWRAPVFYVGTVAVSALLIGLVLGFKNPGLYLLYHLATGGLLFGAVFMITDPVTTPTSPFGNCLIGVVAGLLVVLTRIATNAAEGVVYSLVVINLISPMIDALVKGKTSKRLPVKYGVTFGAAALSVALSIGVAWAQNGGRELYAINGLSIEEYNNVKASCKVDWISANDYDFKVYSKEQPATVQAAYSIIDKDGNEVGVVYLADSKLSGGKFVIETEEYTLSADGSIYVVFELATKNIVGVSLIKGSTAEMYNKKAQDWYNENLNISGGLVNYVPAMDGTIGASYSVLGFQKLIKVAYDAFVSDYGA